MNIQSKFVKFALLLLLLFPVSSVLAADEEEKTPPLVGLSHWRGHETHGILKDFARKMGPLETRLKSAEEAAKVFNVDVFAKLEKRVDFEKQDLLIVQFGGSGQNKLESYVSLSEPPKIMFIIEPGETKDLVDQIHVFAVRKDAVSRRDAMLRGFPRG